MAGDTIPVHSVVPAGVSFHTFDPTPSQIEPLCHATLWFTIGEAFEKKILQTLSGLGTNPVVVDLRNGVPLIEDEHVHCAEGAADPHIWTSPKLMKIQLTTIRNGLQNLFPEQKEEIGQRYEALQKQVDALIRDADVKLGNAKDSIIVVAHGAYGYLCRDYGICQLSIESGGKEVTVKTLESVITQAKAKGVHTVFALKQYPRKGIERVSEILGAKVIELNAYQPDYFGGEQFTIQSFHDAIGEEQ